MSPPLTPALSPKEGRRANEAAPSPCPAASTCSSACATSSTRASAAVGADDLDAEGHAQMVDPARHRRGTRQGHRRRVGDGEPAHVGRHLLAVDLLDEQLSMRERRHRCRRADQHVHVLEESEEALVELGLLDVGPADVAERELQSALGVVDDVAVEQVARFFQALAMRRDELHAAVHLEDVVDAGRNRARAPAPRGRRGGMSRHAP